MFRFAMAVCLVVLFLLPVAAPSAADQASACGGVGASSFFVGGGFTTFQTTNSVFVQPSFVTPSFFAATPVVTNFGGGAIANVNINERRGLLGLRRGRSIQAQAISGGGVSNVNINRGRR